jgi:hypothetical protein
MKEMPKEVLESLGFRFKKHDGGGYFWTHLRSPNQFYFHVLTPDAVECALREIGREEMQKRITSYINEIDLENF